MVTCVHLCIVCLSVIDTGSSNVNTSSIFNGSLRINKPRASEISATLSPRLLNYGSFDVLQLHRMPHGFVKDVYSTGITDIERCSWRCDLRFANVEMVQTKKPGHADHGNTYRSKYPLLCTDYADQMPTIIS